jgi:hypothetical protein
VLWFILCSLVVAIVWRGYRYKYEKKVLELPELWDQQVMHDNQPNIAAGRHSDSPDAMKTWLQTPSGNAPALSLPTAPKTENAGTVANPSQSDLFGREVRGKLKKYTRKRPQKTAVVSNLSVYRQRARQARSESPSKTACT